MAALSVFSSDWLVNRLAVNPAVGSASAVPTAPGFGNAQVAKHNC